MPIPDKSSVLQNTHAGHVRLSERMKAVRFAASIDMTSPKDCELLAVLQSFAKKYDRSVAMSPNHARPIAGIQTPFGLAYAASLYAVWRELCEVKQKIRMQRNLKLIRASGKWLW